MSEPLILSCIVSVLTFPDDRLPPGAPQRSPTVRGRRVVASKSELADPAETLQKALRRYGVFEYAMKLAMVPLGALKMLEEEQGIRGYSVVAQAYAELAAREAAKPPPPPRGLGRPKDSATGYNVERARELKAEARRLRNQGLTWPVIARRLKVSPRTAQRWARAVRTSPPD